MISPNFYTKGNLVTQFLGGKVLHYPVKDKSITYEWYEYRVKANEDLYTIAARIFGDNLEYMWPYIADNNPIKMPDDWKEGDILRLPKVIIRDSDVLTTKYSNVPTDSTAV